MAQGLAFQNPVASLVNDILSALESLLTIPPLPGTPLAVPGALACLGNLQSVMQCHSDYTQFVSGVSPTFPASVIASPQLGPYLPAGTAGLSTFTFTQMLGALSGGLQAQRAMCQTDASNPCALVSGMFNVVGPSGQAQLGDITSGLLAIPFNTLGTDVCSWVTSMIAGLASLIAQGITAILTALTMALQYGLGKSLQYLFGNPCFASFLSSITTPALQSALGVIPSI